jgi:hypothetical protein
MITKNNGLQTKSSFLFSTLLGARLSTISDIEGYKKQNREKFDELISVTDESVKLVSELADKFEQASKLRLTDKYKEYLVLKSQEFRKRSEADKLVAPIVKLFLETKDADGWNKEIDDYNKKSETIMKEAEEIEKKADKIVEDNPTLIK